MKNKLTLFERVVIRLLRESHAKKTIGQAVLVSSNSGSDISAYLYDQNALLNNDDFLSGKMSGDEIKNFFLNDVIQGIIRIKPPPMGNCRGAWMVKSIAGPGEGKTLYGLGYALSPSGLLMSDRKDVSPSARDAWMKAYNSNRKKYPLDDISMHDNDGNPTWRHTNHTTDTFDDCIAFSEFSGEHLNYAYEKNGEEDSLLSFLESNHEMTIEELQKHGEHLPNVVKKLLVSVGNNEFWKKHAPR